MLEMMLYAKCFYVANTSVYECLKYLDVANTSVYECYNHILTSPYCC